MATNPTQRVLPHSLIIIVIGVGVLCLLLGLSRIGYLRECQAEFDLMMLQKDN